MVLNTPESILINSIVAQCTNKDVRKVLGELKQEWVLSQHYKKVTSACQDLINAGLPPSLDRIVSSFSWNQAEIEALDAVDYDAFKDVDLPLALEALKRDWLKRSIQSVASQAVEMEGDDPLSMGQALVANISDLIVKVDTGKLRVNNLRDSMEKLQAGQPLLSAELSRNKVFFNIMGVDETVRMGAGRLGIIAAMPSCGKCLGLGTPVIKSDGSIVPVESVSEGDLLMGAYGDTKTVSGVIRGREEMFRITPVRGEAFTCNKSHILSLVIGEQKLAYRKDWYPGKVINMSVDEYLSLPQGARRRLMLWRTSHDWLEQPTDVPPYILGLWLGDGTFSNACVSCPDPEVILELQAYASASGFDCSVNSYSQRCPTIRVSTPRGQVNPLWNGLKKCRVGGEKRIPREYLINSRPNRMELLAGLLDTDGHRDPRSRSRFEIITKYDGLRDDILFLARSLGFHASCHKKIAGIKSTGFVGEYWRIGISGDIHLIPNRVERKKAHPKSRKYPASRTGFSIESIGEGDYYGFSVDGDGLFVLGDFTVTHNSSMAIQGLQVTATRGGTGLMVSLEMDEAEVNAKRLACWTGRDTWKIVQNHKEMWFNDKHLAAAERCLNITCGAGQDWFSLDAKIRAIHQSQPLDVVIIDYFTLLEPPTKHRSESTAASYGHISKGAKMLAKDLQCCVILVAQFNRTVDENTEPLLKQLKETSQLEQDADFALLMWNSTAQAPKEGERIVNCRIAKNRGGKRGDLVTLVFSPHNNRFIQAHTTMRAA